MTFKMSDEAQQIKIFNLSADTNEFIGAGDAWIPAHTGLPANCTEIEPPESMPGSIAIFDATNETWAMVEDHRGKTVFSTETGDAIFISNLGSLPENTTVLVPDTSFPKWDGSKWIKDELAEKTAEVQENETKKSNLMQQVNMQIVPLQDALDLDMATDEEKAQLLSLKRYRVLLSRVDVNDPVWPPEE